MPLGTLRRRACCANCAQQIKSTPRRIGSSASFPYRIAHTTKSSHLISYLTTRVICDGNIRASRHRFRSLLSANNHFPHAARCAGQLETAQHIEQETINTRSLETSGSCSDTDRRSQLGFLLRGGYDSPYSLNGRDRRSSSSNCIVLLI